MVATMGRQHVVIIGSGFGGIRAAKGLAGVDVDVTIIDVNNFHTFQPLLYQVATAGLDADDIGFPIRGIFRRSKSVQFVLGEVNGIDLEHQTVAIRDGRTLRYDYLVIAAGTISTSFGIEGVEAASPLRYTQYGRPDGGDGGSTTLVQPATAAQVLSLEWQDGGSQDLLTDLGPSDAVLDEGFADERGLGAGDTFPVLTASLK